MVKKTSFAPAAFGKIKTYRSVVSEIAVLLLLLATATLIALNGKYQSAVTSGIELWAATLLPTLFPYVFITYLISSLRVTDKIARKLSPLSVKLLRVNGTVTYALFLSLLSGYPIGAKTVSDLKTAGRIGNAESERAACICASSSPVFIIGSIGSITFANPLFGILLYFAHLLSVISTAIVFSFYKRKEPPKPCSEEQKRSSPDLFDGVYSSVVSVLVIGGIITLFYLLTEILSGIGVLDLLSTAINSVLKDGTLARSVAEGIFECTKGLKTMAVAGIFRLTLPIACSLLGFGGISVIAQSCAYLKKAQIKTAPFILSRIVAAVFGFIYGYIISIAFL